MSEQDQLIQLLKCLDVPYDTYDEPEYIEDKSVKAGAIFCVSIRGVAHINFDKHGHCISSSIDQINSERFADSARKILAYMDAK